jgi:hypothetical protein
MYFIESRKELAETIAKLVNGFVVEAGPLTGPKGPDFPEAVGFATDRDGNRVPVMRGRLIDQTHEDED